MNNPKIVSNFDLDVYNKIRANVRDFQLTSIKKIDLANALILDVAPQVHHGIKEIATVGFIVETIDIDPQYEPTFCGDICEPSTLPNNRYDAIFCTEVLEHVSNPFEAVKGLFLALKPGGILFATSPFGFRIHGPLPDNWRISEHGWKELLKNFEQVKITALEDPNRFLMPLHYSVMAVKGLSNKNIA